MPREVMIFELSARFRWRDRILMVFLYRAFLFPDS